MRRNRTRGSGYFRIGIVCGAVWAGIPAIAWAQDWVTFVDETSTRLVAEPALGSNDVDEKEYAFGDLDQDGDLDVVVARKQEWTTPGRRVNVLFMNEGIKDGHSIDGVLVDRSTEYASLSEVEGSAGFLDLTNDRDIQVADLDGDGWLDVVTATTLSIDWGKYISHPRVYINRGQDENGQWLGLIFDDENRIPTFPSEPRFCGVAAGDVDMDGDNDLFFADYDSGPYPRNGDLDDRLLINDGTGYFTDESVSRMTNQMRDSGFGHSAYILDLNNDGINDVLAADPSNGTSLNYNNPDDAGFFNLFQNYSQASAPYHILAGDLNNDGWWDLIESSDGTDQYHLSQGTGSDSMADFKAFNFTFTNGGGDGGIAGDSQVADLNNDGWLDLVVTDVDIDFSGCSRRTHIYRNLGNAPNVTMQEQTVGTGCGNPNSSTCFIGGIVGSKLKGVHDVALLDINNDGWNDMIVGRCSTTEVYINVPPTGLAFSYPTGLPAGFIAPKTGVTFQVKVDSFGQGVPQPGTAKLYLSLAGGEFSEIALSQIEDNLYEATLPGAACLTTYDFYVTAENTIGEVWSDPAEAPDSTYEAISSLGQEISLVDEVEGDVSAWGIEADGTLTSGTWEQADPVQTLTASCGIIVPEDDASQHPDATMAFVTQNGEVGLPASQSDVDGGATYLTTPLVDLAGSDAVISYARFFESCLGSLDTLNIEVSNDAGQNWTLVESISDTANEWETVGFRVSDFVDPTSEIQVRFWTSDFDNSITDAAIDNFTVLEEICEPTTVCEGDANGDGAIDPLDSGFVLARLGCSVGTGDADCDASDQNFDSLVDPLDVGFVLARFGVCP